MLFKLSFSCYFFTFPPHFFIRHLSSIFRQQIKCSGTQNRSFECRRMYYLTKTFFFFTISSVFRRYNSLLIISKLKRWLLLLLLLRELQR